MRRLLVLAALGCGSGAAGLAPDVVVDTAVPVEAVEAPVTREWSLNFAESDDLAGWSMGDCATEHAARWYVQGSALKPRDACVDESLPESAGLELGDTVRPPDVVFDQGWLIMEAKIFDAGAIGFVYAGNSFIHYRVSLYLEALRARFAVVARPPFALDGGLDADAGLSPSVEVFGENPMAFPPLEAWFEFALEVDGRRHRLYVDGELVLEAELPAAYGPLPGGAFGVYQHDMSGFWVRRLATLPPGPPPWHR